MQKTLSFSRLSSLLLIVVSLGINAKEPTIDDFVRPAQFSQVKISPDGVHLAATFKRGNQTQMAILTLADNKIVKVLGFGESTLGGCRYLNGHMGRSCHAEVNACKMLPNSYRLDSSKVAKNSRL